MLIIGLTGSIGMGKTTVLSMFAKKGIPTFDADAAVHKLYASEASAQIEKAFPGTVENGVVDRQKLSAALAGDADRLKKLEEVVHPLVQQERHKFLRDAKNQGAEMAVLDVPLLFEIGAEKDVDLSVVVSAPSSVQKERVLQRPNMSEEKFAYILSRQIPDAEKRARADIIVDTGTDIADTQKQIDKLIESLKGKAGSAYDRLAKRYSLT